MFIAALFIVSKEWEQLKCPSISNWIKKIWYLYTMGYYSVIRKDEILSFVTIWMDLKNMLTKISQKKLRTV